MFAVSTTDDGHDAVRGDGVCETVAGNGICTLRAAIEESNALAGVAVTVPAGLYTLTTLEAGGRVLRITGDLTLSGAGSEATIVDALNLDVVVEVPAGIRTVVCKDPLPYNAFVQSSALCVTDDGPMPATQQSCNLNPC